MTHCATLTRRGVIRGACRAAAALVAITARARAAQSLPTLRPGQLRIGTYFVNPPFEFISKHQRVGFEVDLTNEVAKRLQLEPVFVDT
jgi:ABC-type amino acid transport substrate-binding protein